MKRLFFLLGLILLMMGCTKEVNLTSTTIMGKWQLIKCGGGIAGYYPPVIVINTLTLNADSTYKTQRNTTVVAEGTFSIKQGNRIFGTRDTSLIYFSNISLGSVIAVRNDTLQLVDNAYDPICSVYIRKN